MKRQMLLVSLILVLATGLSSAASTVTRLVVDLDGEIVLNDNIHNPLKRDPGFAVGVDLIFTQAQTAQLGLGFEYQKERPWHGSTIQFIPIYGFINYHGSANLRRGNQPYFTGRFGYSIFSGPNSNNNNYTSDGDLYYSLGFGINFQDQFQVEAGYASSSGSERWRNSSPTKYTYNRTTVSFGISF